MLAVALVTLFSNAGCKPEQAQAALTAMAQVVAILARQPGMTPGMTPGATPGLTPGSTPFPGSNFPTGPQTGIGPVAGVNPGGMPTNLDGSQPTNGTIPNFGPNPSKAQIGQMLDAAAAKYGIPPDILKAVAWQESRWNPRATSFDGGHGKGIMQIDDRFHQFAKTPQVFDPAANIDYGARFLKQKYDETGSWEAALKRYNGGSAYPPIVMAHAQRKPWTAVA